MRYIEIKTFSCPECKKSFGRGFIGFGPAVIRCPKCNTCIKTELEDWSKLRFSEKIVVSARELIAPTVFAYEAFNSFIINFFIFSFFSFLPYGASHGKHFGLIIFALIYPGLLILRLFDRIRKTILYHRHGIVPAGKWWLRVFNWHKGIM